MAKCTACNARKGKRKCKATGTIICSQCCGESRTPEKCDGCSFFANAQLNRNYTRVPYFTTGEMANSSELENVSQVIETALTDIWVADRAHVNDNTVSRLVELLLDHYHFNDSEPAMSDPVLKMWYPRLVERFETELNRVPAEKLVKVLAAVYRSIQRRTVGGSSYLNFISRYTNPDIDGWLP